MFHRYGLGGFDGDTPVDGAVRGYSDRGAGGLTIAVKRLETIMKVSATLHPIVVQYVNFQKVCIEH